MDLLGEKQVQLTHRGAPAAAEVGRVHMCFDCVLGLTAVTLRLLWAPGLPGELIKVD